MKQRGFLFIVFIGMAALSFLAMLMPGLAKAHAAFVRSDPPPEANLDKPPRQVTIWFSQELARDSEIKVFDKAGQRIDLDNTQVSFADTKSMTTGLRTLSPGAYRVDWESVSLEDGDRDKGSFSFSVGDGNGRANVFLIVGLVLGILVIGAGTFALLRSKRRVD